MHGQSAITKLAKLEEEFMRMSLDLGAQVAKPLNGPLCLGESKLHT
jgi:hypothetical protein